MHAVVHAADVQDRDGGALLMATLFGLYPFLLKLYADGGYQGAGFQAAMAAVLSQVNVEIVKRSDQAGRFVVLPKRWLVARHGYKTPARVREEQTMPQIAIDPTFAATLPLAA